MRRSWIWILFSMATAGVVHPAHGAGSPVDATVAYREAFGPPPVVEGGACLAAVVFLPGIGSSADPGRLSALPLFSLKPEHVVKEVARVLVEGYPTPVRLFQPPRVFPEGSTLVSVEAAAGRAAVEVAAPDASSHPLSEQALVHTLTQFEDVRTVTLLVRGRGPAAHLTPRRGLVEPPPPPRLLDVVSPVHAGEDPEEIDVLFDRPIELESFTLRLEDDTGLPGRTYVSMFDMAVVIRPDDPKILRDGLPLEAQWSVRDKTGRHAEGRRKVELRLLRRRE